MTNKQETILNVCPKCNDDYQEITKELQEEYKEKVCNLICNKCLKEVL